MWNNKLKLEGFVGLLNVIRENFIIEDWFDGYMANNCLTCNTDINEDRIYCDDCLKESSKEP